MQRTIHAQQPSDRRDERGARPMVEAEPDELRRVARVAAMLPVVMLALPFALGPLRSSGQGARTVIGILIGAGDQRFLAWAMAGAFAVYAPAALMVRLAGGGLGWLWAALGLFMVARWVTLHARFRTDRWIVLGDAPRR